MRPVQIVGKLLILSFVVAPILSAQEATDPQLVRQRLAADFRQLSGILTDEGPLRDEPYSWADIQARATYSQRKVMNAYATHLRQFEFRLNSITPRKQDEASLAFRSFVSPDQEFKLTSALAGRDLTEGQSSNLADAIVGIVEGSVACREAARSLRDCPFVRTPTANVTTSLISVGVSRELTIIVVDSILRGAEALAMPPTRTVYK